jgi:nitric oxide reductase NorQ protein
LLVKLINAAGGGSSELFANSSCSCQTFTKLRTCDHISLVTQAASAYASAKIVTAVWVKSTGTSYDMVPIREYIKEISPDDLSKLLRAVSINSDTSTGLSAELGRILGTVGDAEKDDGKSLIDRILKHQATLSPEPKANSIQGYVIKKFPEAAMSAASAATSTGNTFKSLISKPRPTEFKVTAGTWQSVLFNLCYPGNHVMLCGPSGSGKTELVEYATKFAGRTLFKVNCGAMTDARLTLIGNTVFEAGKGTRFIESGFAAAIQRAGTVILLDEISRAGADAFNILLPLLDGQRYLSLDEDPNGKRITLADDVSIFATANIGTEYTGTFTLDRALSNRFTMVHVDFPQLDDEIKLCVERTKVPESVAKQQCKFAHEQRQAARKGSFSTEISTRVLLKACSQVMAGMAIDPIIDFTLLGDFSREGGDQSDYAKAVVLAKAHFFNYGKGGAR